MFPGDSLGRLDQVLEMVVVILAEQCDCAERP